MGYADRLKKKHIDDVWDKGHKMRGKNPNLFRKDDLGNIIYKPAYGTTGEKGWEVDHVKPKARGGSDNISNLRPLQTEANREKQDKLRAKK